MGWLKNRRRGRRETDTGRAGVCDSCDAPTDAADGYLLPTATVVLSELFWAKVFTNRKTENLDTDDEVALFMSTLLELSKRSSPWMICEECSEFFVFNRNRARSHAIGHTRPADAGAVDYRQGLLFAAMGWERVYGRWSPAVEVPPAAEPCAVCRKTVYQGEETVYVSTERMGRLRTGGFIERDPVGEPQPGDEGAGWQICRPCFARLHARLRRAAPSG